MIISYDSVKVKMIICYLGGIGSGKTLSVVREIVLRSAKKQYAITNFRLKLPKESYYRLKIPDVLGEEEYKTTAGRTNTRMFVNWKFWENLRNERPNFCIYLDEIHNLVHSRSSMSKVNKYMSKWISQVRKILSDRENSHFFMISQTLRKIDVDFRELTHIFIACEKLTIGKNIYIIHKYYNSLESYMYGIHYRKSIFKANPFFRFYDHNKLVTFEDSEVYI